MKNRKAGILAGGTALALLAGMIVGTVAPAYAAEEPALVDYDFSAAPGDGKTVANLADSHFEDAEIQGNGVFQDSSLVLSGGNKASGTWVKLPDNLLVGQSSVTIQTEVKADSSMLNDYHFLWNIGNDSSATEYLFASLACKNGRTPLVGVKANARETLIQADHCATSADTWVSVTTVFDGDTDPAQASLYLNGNLVAKGNAGATLAEIKDQSLNTIARSPWPDNLFKGAITNFRIFGGTMDEEQIQRISEDDALVHAEAIRESAQQLLDSLELSDTEVASPYFALPSLNGRVTWASSDEGVIALDGTVTRPAKGQPDKTVRLTASASLRGIEASKSVNVIVKAQDKDEAEILEEMSATYVVPPVLRSGDQLPEALAGTILSFEGTNGINIDQNRIVSIDASVPIEGLVTTTIAGPQEGNTSISRSFKVTVLPAESSAELLAYHRNATSELVANNGDIAYSMHLALKEGEDWDPLNGNYGVFFPKNYIAPKNGDDVLLGSHRSLKDPMVFNLKDGTYGVIGVRTKQGSPTPDETGRTSILFATSKDLLSYEEEENSRSIIDVGETNGVNSPYAVYDSDRDLYLVGWKDDSGIPKYTTFADLKNSDSSHGALSVGDIATMNENVAADEIDDYVPGNSIAITSEQQKLLRGRLGRISNTSMAPLNDQQLFLEDEPTIEDIILPKTATLNYSDGSTASLPVEQWNLDNIDFTKPGRYTVEGKIKQMEYPLPFAEERADPSIEKWQWTRDGITETKFLMIASNDIDGDVVWQKGTPHMPLRMADSIAELADTPGNSAGLISSSGFNPKENILLQAGDQMKDGTGMWASFWAPEIHEIGGKLTILFMPGYSKTNWFDGAAAVMQLKKDDNGDDLDPTQAENWTAPEKVLRADGTDLSITNSGKKGMSLDMSYFEDEAGRSYYTWQQLGAVYIATMDPTNPARLTSDPVLIVSPEYAWDNAIAEGPNVVSRDGQLYMIYSGSSVGKTYTTGLAVADASGNTDLLDPNSWVKLNYPIQKSDLYNGQWQLGTGHGMWSEDEDGQMIYVFHAYANWTEGYYNGAGRDAFVRRVHWAADGMPILDMGLEEEVAPGTTARFDVIVAPDEGPGGGGEGTDPECEGDECEEPGEGGEQLSLAAEFASKPVAGSTIRVLTDTNGVDADLSYQWFIDDDKVSQSRSTVASGDTIVLAHETAGKVLSVKVTATHETLGSEQRIVAATIAPAATGGGENGSGLGSGTDPESEEAGNLANSGADLSIALMTILGLAVAGVTLRLHREE